MSQSKGKILVVSRDPKLADKGKAVLEAAGFSVISAMDDIAVEQACSSNGIKLILLGFRLTLPIKGVPRQHVAVTATFPF